MGRKYFPSGVSTIGPVVHPLILDNGLRVGASIFRWGFPPQSVSNPILLRNNYYQSIGKLTTGNAITLLLDLPARVLIACQANTQRNQFLCGALCLCSLYMSSPLLARTLVVQVLSELLYQQEKSINYFLCRVSTQESYFKNRIKINYSRALIGSNNRKYEENNTCSSLKLCFLTSPVLRK